MIFCCWIVFKMIFHSDRLLYTEEIQAGAQGGQAQNSLIHNLNYSPLSFLARGLSDPDSDPSGFCTCMLLLWHIVLLKNCLDFHLPVLLLSEMSIRKCTHKSQWKPHWNVSKAQTLLFMQRKDSLLSLSGEMLGTTTHGLLAPDSELYDRQNNSDLIHPWCMWLLSFLTA